MRNMKLISKLGLVLLFSLFLTQQAAATGFDAKSNLICATKDVVGCVYEGSCVEGRASTFDLPTFVVFNFEKKQVTSTKEAGIKDVSPIKNMEITEELILLQGVENHHGWTAGIDRESGHLSITISGPELSYMVFGACTGL